MLSYFCAFWACVFVRLWDLVCLITGGEGGTEGNSETFIEHKRGKMKCAQLTEQGGIQEQGGNGDILPKREDITGE